jgi:ribonuclease HII
MKKDLKNINIKYLIGIDEVGRGPIAGPVAVGAFVYLEPEAKKYFRGVKESKQLTEEKREIWFEKIEKARKDGLIDFVVIFQSEKVIDKKGISFAIKKALAMSIAKLKIKPDEARVLLDGGLKAPIEYENQKTIIKGDVKEQVIALASICAKVTRDRKMRVLAKKYPEYSFDVNKGYGTRKHYEAVKKFGLISLHRRSFCKSIFEFAKNPNIS